MLTPAHAQAGAVTEAYAFGPFRLLARRRELFSHGVPVLLGQRAIEILLALVERHGQLVTKQELIHAVWPGAIVEENNLQAHISAVRKALGDDKGERRYLLTVTGRGYRFIAPVAREDADTVSATGSPAKTLETASTNLPHMAGALIGRETDLASVAQRLESNRLVTLVGPGGVGKTRLALEAGTKISDRFPDGVWLTELAPVGDPKLVAAIVAESLSAVLPAKAETLQALIAALKAKNLLLILDNCEHVIEDAARVAEALMRGCPWLRILASSRERLAIPGETVINVQPLAVPEGVAGSAQAASGFPAVRLFVERAGSVTGGFAITDGNVEAISAICRRLDGLPLAIELAVARLKVMSLDRLLRGLDERFKLLTAGNRTALPRQQTLQALFDWSYELLNEAERELFGRLSVFAGSADLAAIFATAGHDRTEGEVLDLLGALAEKSLLIADVTSEESRYRMLELARSYASERLGKGGAAFRERHARYFVARLVEATAAWETTATDAWLAQYAPDLDQLRAALEWSFGPECQTAIGLQLVGYSHVLWSELGLVLEHRYWVTKAVSSLDASIAPEIHARVLSWQAGDVRDMDDPSDYDDAMRAAELYGAMGNSFGKGQMLLRAGASGLLLEHEAETARLLQEAHKLLAPSGKTKSLARCLSALASARMFAGDMGAAQALHKQAVDMLQSQ